MRSNISLLTVVLSASLAVACSDGAPPTNTTPESTGGTVSTLPDDEVSPDETTDEVAPDPPSKEEEPDSPDTPDDPETVKPPLDPDGLIRPPAGRLAIVADGNSPDPDDIGATAVIFALLEASALSDRLVHLSHSCDLKPPFDRISAEDEQRRQDVLTQLCEDGESYFGPFDSVSKYFNNRSEQEASVNDLRDAINASTAGDPLWIIEAGEPDIIAYALEAAQPAKREHVRVVSHHPANDNSGDFFTWQEVLDYGVTEHQIGDQNVKLQSTIPVWDWAKNHEREGIAWIWDQLDYAEKDGVVKFQTNKFDCSDAGMIYWWITGADASGNKLATPEDIKKMLLGSPALQ